MVARSLPVVHPPDVRLVHVHLHFERAKVGHRHDGTPREPAAHGWCYDFADLGFLAEDRAAEGRADVGVLEVGFGEVVRGTRRLQPGLRRRGAGCRLLAYDLYPNRECSEMGVEYVTLPELYAQADILSLHCPLTPETHHLIDARALAQIKPGVMLINTSRGALIDTAAVIEALKSGQVGYLGLDVYEEEEALFFEDLSGAVIRDDIFARLLTFPNVLVTSHQAFLTQEALAEIARVTAANLTALAHRTPFVVGSVLT